MRALKKEGKTFLLKQNSGRKRNLSFRDLRIPVRIVRKDDKNTAPRISAELNDHLDSLSISLFLMAYQPL